MTDRTLQIIEAVRCVARGEIVIEFTREDFAQAFVELVGVRPNVLISVA